MTGCSIVSGQLFSKLGIDFSCAERVRINPEGLPRAKERSGPSVMP